MKFERRISLFISRQSKQTVHSLQQIQHCFTKKTQDKKIKGSGLLTYIVFTLAYVNQLITEGISRREAQGEKDVGRRERKKKEIEKGERRGLNERG